MGFWGDTFYSRIIVSLIGTFIGGVIIGSHIDEKLVKLMSFVYSVPIILFWISLGYIFFSEKFLITELSFSHKYFIIPLVLVFLTWPIAYFGAGIGNGIIKGERVTNLKGLFNIEWYHWLWIVPLLLWQITALFSISILSFLYEGLIEDENYGLFSIIADLLTNFASTIMYLVYGAILGIIFWLVSHLYKLLTNSTEYNDLKWLQLIVIVLIIHTIFYLIFRLDKGLEYILPFI